MIMIIITRTFVAALLIASAGCAASSRQRPVDVGDVSTGEGSLAATRKQFEGNWKLVSLQINAEDGKKSDLDATGNLTSDAFGVLAIEYRLSEQGLKSMAAMGIKSPNPVISTTGRAVSACSTASAVTSESPSKRKTSTFHCPVCAMPRR